MPAIPLSWSACASFPAQTCVDLRPRWIAQASATAVRRQLFPLLFAWGLVLRGNSKNVMGSRAGKGSRSVGEIGGGERVTRRRRQRQDGGEQCRGRGFNFFLKNWLRKKATWERLTAVARGPWWRWVASSMRPKAAPLCNLAYVGRMAWRRIKSMDPTLQKVFCF
jgi:hypothetical protein